MLQKADSPPPEAITPYRRALVVNRYKIKEAKDSTACESNRSGCRMGSA